MLRFVFILFFFSGLLPLGGSGQPDSTELKGGKINGAPNPHDKPVEGKTYAVIVGINRYQSTHIPILRYAVSDALAFRDFLLSRAGGEVPPENIRIFLNDSATTGRFKNYGLKWLRLKVQKGDRVFLYFSGHGVTINGGDSYFLAHNLAPDFSIENIEEAGTQALYQLKNNCIRPLHDAGVQVILIMDACRAEVADSLQSKTVNSFAPDISTAEMNAGDIFCLSSSNGEASVETSKGGINHGIFTYYLLKGLYGFADNSIDGNGLITLNKLKNYVESVVSQYTKEKQRPVIDYKGRDNPLISVVDPDIFARLKKAEEKNNNLGYSLSDEFVSKGFSGKDSILLYREFLQAIETGPLWGKGSGLYCFRELEKNYTDLSLLRESALLLLASLVDSGQTVINAYLGADQKILKGYGQQLDRNFEKGAKIFDTLYRISKRYFPNDPENKTYLKQFYFMKGRSWINASNREVRVSALQYLQNAYQLDSSAAYICNSLGLYFKENLQNDSAIYYLQKAMDKAPEWAYPCNTMGTVMLQKGNGKKAEEYFLKAIDLNPRYPSPYINLGDLYSFRSQPERAIAYYRQALALMPCSGYALYRIGKQYQKLSREKEALAAFEESYECDKNRLAAKELNK